MKHHSSNPAVMKEVARTLKNVAEASPEYAQKIIDDGLLEQCMNTLTSHPNECGVFVLDIMDSVLTSAADRHRLHENDQRLGFSAEHLSRLW